MSSLRRTRRTTAHGVAGGFLLDEAIAEARADELFALEAEEARASIVHPEEASAVIRDPYRIEESVQDRLEFGHAAQVQRALHQTVPISMLGRTVLRSLALAQTC